MELEKEAGRNCLFCEKPEKKYRPSKGIEFVCSRCTGRFVEMSQDSLGEGILYLELNKANFCLLGDYTVIDNKIKALNMFIEEEHHAPINPKARKRHIGKHLDRRGNLKADRFDKIAARGVTKQRKVPVFESEPEQPTVS